MKVFFLIVSLFFSSSVIATDEATSIMDKHEIANIDARQKVKTMGLLLYCESVFQDLRWMAKAMYLQYVDISIWFFEDDLERMLMASNELALMQIEAFKAGFTPYEKDQCIEAINSRM